MASPLSITVGIEPESWGPILADLERLAAVADQLPSELLALVRSMPEDTTRFVELTPVAGAETRTGIVLRAMPRRPLQDLLAEAAAATGADFRLVNEAPFYNPRGRHDAEITV